MVLLSLLVVLPLLLLLLASRGKTTEHFLLSDADLRLLAEAPAEAPPVEAPEETQESPISNDELTNAAQVYADPTRCTLWPAGYSFDAEGLVAHPSSTPTDPKCILVRNGMGLLQSADATQCDTQPDQLDLKWENPLNRAGTSGNVITRVFSDHVSGLDRCTVSFRPDATAEDLATADVAIVTAGSELRSRLPIVLRALETTTSSLGVAVTKLTHATAQMVTDAAQLGSGTTALSSCKGQLAEGQTQLVALAAAGKTAVETAASECNNNFAAVKVRAQQMLIDKNDADQVTCQAAIDGAVASTG